MSRRARQLSIGGHDHDAVSRLMNPASRDADMVAVVFECEFALDDAATAVGLASQAPRYGRRRLLVRSGAQR